MSRGFAGASMAHAPTVKQDTLSAIPQAGFTLWRHRWAVGLCIAVAAGILFRLIWVSDMEYKEDETWTLSHVEDFWRTGRLAPIGMPSSAQLPNAGMSLWVFVALSAFLPSIDPINLARAVQLLNVGALLLLALFVRKNVDRAEREAWY
jgi:hypothetical protein